MDSSIAATNSIGRRCASIEDNRSVDCYSVASKAGFRSTNFAERGQLPSKIYVPDNIYMVRLRSNGGVILNPGLKSKDEIYVDIKCATIC